MRLVIIIIILWISSCVLEDRMISIINKLDKIIELMEQKGSTDEQ